MLNLEVLKHKKYHKIYVALSGGIDSCVLLHQLIQCKKSLKLLSEIPALNHLEAIYIDHQLSDNSKQWGEFCHKLCQSYQIPCHISIVNAIAATRQSTEAVAREARYEAFRKIVGPRDVLLTAHHQNDQAETLLLRMCRGAGVKGLSAMKEEVHYQGISIVRPMLSVSKKQIIDYAQEHQLTWINDESNEETSYRRNFLRHHILPVFEQSWPAIIQILSRVAEQQAEASVLLTEIGDQDLENCLYENIQIPLVKNQVISARKLLVLSDIRIKNLIQCWLSNNHYPLLSAKLYQELLIKLKSHQNNNIEILTWLGPKGKRNNDCRYTIYLYRDALFCYHYNQSPQHLKALTKSYCFDSNHDCSLQLPNGSLKVLSYFELKEKYERNKLLCMPTLSSISDLDSVKIYYQSAINQLTILNKKQKTKLKKFFQEKGIPVPIRAGLPFIFSDEKLIQIGNIGFNKEDKFLKEDEKYLFFESSLEHK